MPVEAVSFDFLGEATALGKVLLIDVVLAGDNAVVVGMAAANVRAEVRTKVVFYGVAIAVALRIAFALIATEMLAIVGLTFAGGILLLWVAWKMYREIRASDPHPAGIDADGAAPATGTKPEKSFGQALVQLIIADVSMSLDNVLAVAGAARDHMVALVIGLVLSIALMGTAASLIATYLHKWRWLTWTGLVIIVLVAIDMIWRGLDQIACSGAMPDMCRHAAAALVITG
jgi:YjbE family integral membrane protein